MEQVQQLLEILKQTPEMALWGLAIWCLYILAKLASVVFALKAVMQLAIKKWHDFKVKSLEIKSIEIETEKERLNLENEKTKLDYSKTRFKQDKDLEDIKRLAKRFNKAKISDVEMSDFIMLIDAIKSTSYIHDSDIKNAIKKLSA